MGVGVLDLEALLAPLPDGEGAGADLRVDESPKALYPAVRAQRNDARSGERMLDDDHPDANPAAIMASWREVKKLGVEALATQSKDFEIAAWMAEAMVRIDGLPGLTDIAETIARMCDTYWETGYPHLRESDALADRVKLIGNLSGSGSDGTIMASIRRYPLFERGDGSEGDLFTWQRAEEAAAISDPERRQARINSGVPEFDTLLNEARASLAMLRRAGQEARTALEAWTAMDAALTARAGRDAPSIRRVSEALQAIIDIETRVGGAPAEAAPAEEAPAEAEASGGAAGAPAAAGGGGGGPKPLRTREDAIRQIEEIAEYFRKTEPHSPLASTLDDAARRARLPLTELLAEVLPDSSARRMLLTALGIRVPDEYG